MTMEKCCELLYITPMIKIKTLYDKMAKLAKAFIAFAHMRMKGKRLKNIILFSSMPDFGDSAVEVFRRLYESDALSCYKFIWFVDSKFKPPRSFGKNVIFKRKIHNPIFRLWYLPLESSAKLTVYTHLMIGNMFNDKQIRAFINHGSLSLKSHIGTKVIKKNVYENTHRIVDYSTYTFTAQGKKETALGLPRNDRLFDSAANIRKAAGLDHYDKIIIWMPTFKHYRHRDKIRLRRNDFNIERDYDISLQAQADFYESADGVLSKFNMLLLIKYHPGQDLDYVSLKETDNIKIWDINGISALPFYSVLGATDALITDFSSVYGDYLLINKPIAFDITDIDIFYKKEDIPIVLPFMTGEKINSVTEFCAFLENIALGVDNFAAMRERLCAGAHKYPDAYSTERVSEFLLSKLLNLD